MLSFLTRGGASSCTSRSIAPASANPVSQSGLAPSIANRKARLGHPALSLAQPRATYYFAAHHQTALSFQSLLNQWDGKSKDSPVLPALCAAMHGLLQSLRPRTSADPHRQAEFDRLLTMHLRHLDVPALMSLCAALRHADFHCAITDPASRNVSMHNTMETTDGTQQQPLRILIDTPMLYARLDALIAERRQPAPHTAAQERLDANCMQALRNMLAECAASWQHQPAQCGANLMAAARKFSSVLGLGDWPQHIEFVPQSSAPIATQPTDQLTLHSLVHGNESTLFAAASLGSYPANQTLVTKVLRDLLELAIMKQCFGMHTHLALLLPDQAVVVRRLIDAVMHRSLSEGITPALRNCANRVVAQQAHFGTVQIMPPVGTRLGHAWIAPHLSIVPNRNYSVYANDASIFMQTGNSPAPQSIPMKRWPAKFLNETENEKLYPAEEAWQLTVPVDRDRLQQAAEETRAHWLDHQLPYLFMGTAPDQSSSGCRATVWQAIWQGMDADAMKLFMHFNGGLPDPDSPIELWLRINGFMQWMRDLADPS